MNDLLNFYAGTMFGMFSPLNYAYKIRCTRTWEQWKKTKNSISHIFLLRSIALAKFIENAE